VCQLSVHNKRISLVEFVMKVWRIGHTTNETEVTATTSEEGAY